MVTSPRRPRCPQTNLLTAAIVKVLGGDDLANSYMTSDLPAPRKQEQPVGTGLPGLLSQAKALEADIQNRINLCKKEIKEQLAKLELLRQELDKVRSMFNFNLNK